MFDVHCTELSISTYSKPFHSPAPYKAITRTVTRISDKEVELTCESQGLPLTSVTWSDGKLNEPRLTNRSETSHAKNSYDVFVVTSRLSVSPDANNYTCSYMTDEGKTIQTATFRIPGGCVSSHLEQQTSCVKSRAAKIS